MSDQMIPKWQRELTIFRRIKSCIIFEGNVFDTFIYPGDEQENLPKGSSVGFAQYLHNYFKSAGYSAIVFYDAIHGFTNDFDRTYLQTFASLSRATVTGNGISAAFSGRDGSASFIVENALKNSYEAKQPTVIILDFASRYISDPGNLNQDEVNAFTVLLQNVLKAGEVMSAKGPLKNMCILVVNKLNDLPAWFYLDNPAVKTIVLQTPSSDERKEMLAGDNLRKFFAKDVWEHDSRNFVGTPEELETMRSKIRKRFAGLTEGFTYSEIIGLKKLCREQRITVQNMCSVIDLYKFGITENPWDKVELPNAEQAFEERVKGQHTALMQTLDVVKRAVTGMADITSSAHGKPKGVLFFAGPTGTGKTETAKTLAELIFGDENACIRFDMSEFREAHSDQRLLGAPPGYVGYESGGQLTNAVKNNPFSILLFDEIEKAHPSILDKFLQILEDGRMTDGKGETVYFSECIIIFTSNLGIYEEGPDSKKHLIVSMDMDYESLRNTVKTSIGRYFKETLGRPEILNRIGDNIVVFDFIREEVAQRILTAKLKKIISDLADAKNISLQYSDTVKNQLLQKALGNLENGGRGIINVVESMFINPLSRFMFDHQILSDSNIFVESINENEMPFSINCQVT